MAAPGNLHRRGKRLRQVGEQLGHLLAALEIVLGGQPAPVVLVETPPLRDADQRVMGLEVVAGGVEHLVGGDQRHTGRVGKVDEDGLAKRFLRQVVTLQLAVEAIAEGFRQPVEPAQRNRFGPAHDRLAHRPGNAARQADQALGVISQRIGRHMRARSRHRVEMRAADQLHQVRIALGGRRQQDQGRKRRIRLAATAVFLREGDRDLTADDRLDAVAHGFFGELQRAEQVARIRHRDRGLLVGLGELDQILDVERALEERKRGMDPQMNEAGTGVDCAHDCLVPCRSRAAEARRNRQSPPGDSARPAPKPPGYRNGFAPGMRPAGV